MVKRVVAMVVAIECCTTLLAANSTRRTLLYNMLGSGTARAQHLDMSRCQDVAKCSSVGGELLYNMLQNCWCLSVGDVWCCTTCCVFVRVVEFDTYRCLNVVGNVFTLLLQRQLWLYSWLQWTWIHFRRCFCWHLGREYIMQLVLVNAGGTRRMLACWRCCGDGCTC